MDRIHEVPTVHTDTDHLEGSQDAWTNHTPHASHRGCGQVHAVSAALAVHSLDGAVLRHNPIIQGLKGTTNVCLENSHCA